MVRTEYRNGRCSMTRQHFERLAAIIADLEPEIRQHVAERFACELRGSNPRFNPDRFVRVATGEARS